MLRDTAKRGLASLRSPELGAHHLDTLAAANSLAMQLQAQGQLAEAEPLRRRFASSREMAAARSLGCGAQHKLKTCAKCRAARFCSDACIARSWPEHKRNCRLWAAAQGNDQP